MDDDKIVLIAPRIVAIEYLDEEKAKAEGIKEYKNIWRHDFKVKDGEIWGLPDGSLLIRSRSGKKLWGWR